MTRTVRDVQLERLRAMNAEDKIRAAEDLRRAAWELKAAWIRARQQELPEAAVQAQVRRAFRDASI